MLNSVTCRQSRGPGQGPAETSCPWEERPGTSQQPHGPRKPKWGREGRAAGFRVAMSPQTRIGCPLWSCGGTGMGAGDRWAAQLCPNSLL